MKGNTMRINRTATATVIALTAAGLLAGCGDPADDDATPSATVSEDAMMEEDDAMMEEDDKMEDDDSMMEESPGHDDDAMMEEDDKMEDEDAMMEEDA